MSPRQAYYALEAGILPGTKMGRKWASTSALLRETIEQRLREAAAASGKSD